MHQTKGYKWLYKTVNKMMNIKNKRRIKNNRTQNVVSRKKQKEGMWPNKTVNITINTNNEEQ